MRADDFVKFIAEETLKFDEEMMADIRPADGWTIRVIDFGRVQFELWSKATNNVRRLAEGLHYVPSNLKYSKAQWPTVPMGTPINITQDRFVSTWPNLTQKWK